jgi:hypothetical protein
LERRWRSSNELVRKELESRNGGRSCKRSIRLWRKSASIGVSEALFFEGDAMALDETETEAAAEEKS